MTAPLPIRVGLPPAGLERRLQAFVLDRVLAWGLAGLAWWWVPAVPVPSGPGEAAVALLLVTALAEVALALPLGVLGVSPGSATRGLRLVHRSSGRPIGLAPGLARAGLLTAALVPTAGAGAAALGWSAATDPGRRRRGWHDRWTGGVVVDARPGPRVAPAREGRAAMVNLTALRLAPGPDLPLPAPGHRDP